MSTMEAWVMPDGSQRAYGIEAEPIDHDAILRAQVGTSGEAADYSARVWVAAAAMYTNGSVAEMYRRMGVLIGLQLKIPADDLGTTFDFDAHTGGE